MYFKGGAQGQPFPSLGPTPPIQPVLSAVLNYVSQNSPRPAFSGAVSGSNDWIWPGHTPAGLVTMEEIGILVEKAQVRCGLARGQRARLI